MAPPGLFNPLDPTLQFLFPTFWSVLFIEADDGAKTLSLKLPTLAEFSSHAFDPAVFIGLAELAVFLYAVRGAKRKLSRAESLAANWHLWNGILIYTMMDGLNGAFSEFGFLPLLHKNAYQLVDRRYRRHLIGKGPQGPSAYEADVVRLMNAAELFVYSWMSLLVAIGIARKAKWHKTLEVIVLTMAAFGAFFFIAPDYLNGCLNMQPVGVPTCTPPLTPFYFFFVYFGVAINWIWLAVPIGMLAARVRADMRAKAA